MYSNNHDDDDDDEMIMNEIEVDDPPRGNTVAAFSTRADYCKASVSTNDLGVIYETKAYPTTDRSVLNSMIADVIEGTNAALFARNMSSREHDAAAADGATTTAIITPTYIFKISQCAKDGGNGAQHEPRCRAHDQDDDRSESFKYQDDDDEDNSSVFASSLASYFDDFRPFVAEKNRQPIGRKITSFNDDGSANITTYYEPYRYDTAGNSNASATKRDPPVF